MELTTTRVYAILDTLEATVILTMTTVVPLHVFMVSDGLNLGAHWPINGWTHAIALVAKEAKFHFWLLTSAFARKKNNNNNTNNSITCKLVYILDFCVCVSQDSIIKKYKQRQNKRKQQKKSKKRYKTNSACLCSISPNCDGSVNCTRPDRVNFNIYQALFRFR